VIALKSTSSKFLNSFRPPLKLKPYSQIAITHYSVVNSQSKVYNQQKNVDY